MISRHVNASRRGAADLGLARLASRALTVRARPRRSCRLLVHKEAQVISIPHGAFARHWKEIGLSFLKLGATAYGGPAITGLIQTELQEKRQWVSKRPSGTSARTLGSNPHVLGNHPYVSFGGG